MNLRISCTRFADNIRSAPEKPKVVPAPAPPPVPLPAQVSTPPVSTPQLDDVAELEVSASEEVQVQPEHQGWEEPTTAEAPTWDDEPQTQTSLPVTQDGWLATSIELQPKVADEAPAVSVPEPEPQPPAQTFPVHQPVQQKTVQGSPIPAQAKPATPVSYAKSLNVHRNSGRFKTTDQAVVMPSSSFSTVEKLGVQFGSVNLGGDEAPDNSSL